MSETENGSLIKEANAALDREENLSEFARSKGIPVGTFHNRIARMGYKVRRQLVPIHPAPKSEEPESEEPASVA
jgi:hypothetical protein